MPLKNPLQMSIYLQRELAEAVTDEAWASRRTKAQVVRDALVAYRPVANRVGGSVGKVNALTGEPPHEKE